jgi:hypothetical protein
MSHDWDEYYHYIMNVGPPSSMNLNDAAQIAGLRPRPGDVSPHHDFNSRLGHVFTLQGIGVGDGTHKTITLVSTPQYPTNIPIAYQLRFGDQDTGGLLSPFVPAGVDGVQINLIKSIDPKAGAAIESFTLGGGEAQSTCMVIARALMITATIIGSEGVSLVVQAAVCPTQTADCAELTGNNLPYAHSAMQFFPASSSTTIFAAAHTTRKQFIVQNTSTNSSLIIAFGAGASFTGPVGTVVLPPGVDGVYESPLGGYAGLVTGAWDSPSANGGALVTEGFN